MTDNPLHVLQRALTTCPDHGLPDCSPLLNGCARVIENDAALTQVENLVQAAQNALPCIDRNATFPAQMLADALAPFKDTP